MVSCEDTCFFIDGVGVNQSVRVELAEAFLMWECFCTAAGHGVPIVVEQDCGKWIARKGPLVFDGVAFKHKVQPSRYIHPLFVYADTIGEKI